MDQEDPGSGHRDDEPAQKGQQVGEDEAEEVPEGEEEEDVGDGVDEGPGEVLFFPRNDKRCSGVLLQ